MERSICGGSIDWLRRDTQFALERKEFLRDAGYQLWPYFTSGILGFLPFLLIKKLKKLLIWLVLGFLSLMPLFILAYDYGRWLCLFFSLSIINFFYDSIHEDFELRNFPVVLIPIYCFCWNVQHFMAPGFDFGMLDPIIFAFWGKM